MLITRNGQAPIVHPSAVIASSAQVIGNVSIGESCYVDYNAVIESSVFHFFARSKEAVKYRKNQERGAAIGYGG